MTSPTLPTTPIYGLTLPTDDVALLDLALAIRTASQATEAALARGGYVAPNAADLAALAGRVTALEASGWTAWGLASPCASYTGGTTPAVAGGPYPTFSYRTAGKAGRLRGWVTNSAALVAGQKLTATALPAALRPTQGQTLWAPAEVTDASGTWGRHFRMELFSDGHLYAARAIASGSFINFDQSTWSIP